MSPEFVYVAAALVGVLGSARIVRLVTSEDFPPAVWLRIKWDGWTNDGPWSKLGHCLWCLSPYVVAPNLAWALLSDLHWTWWVFNGWLAASYVASIIVYFDEGSD